MKEGPDQAVADWFVYLLRCRDDSLYAGITRDPARRLLEHNSTERGAKYTRGRRPVQLVYAERCPSRSRAMVRERQIKKLRRAAKLALVEGGEVPDQDGILPI